MHIIDLSANTALTTLDVSSTSLTALDVSKNTSITSIIVSGCPISSFIIKGNFPSLIGQYVVPNGVKGVVFYANSVVKIVSVDEASKTWGYYGTLIGATSSNDGKANTDMIASDSDAAKWCRAKGAAWYLPAKEEISMISINLIELNIGLSAIGETQLDNHVASYWSSSEASINTACGIVLRDGYLGNYEKSMSLKVRAVRIL